MNKRFIIKALYIHQYYKITINIFIIKLEFNMPFWSKKIKEEKPSNNGNNIIIKLNQQ